MHAAKSSSAGSLIKAGLAEEPAAVLLGLLLEAAGTLAGTGAGIAQRRWREAGEAALSTSGRKT